MSDAWVAGLRMSAADRERPVMPMSGRRTHAYFFTRLYVANAGNDG